MKVCVVRTDTLPIVSCALTTTELLRHIEVVVNRFELPLLAKLPHSSETAYTIPANLSGVCIATWGLGGGSWVGCKYRVAPRITTMMTTPHNLPQSRTKAIIKRSPARPTHQSVEFSVVPRLCGSFMYCELRRCARKSTLPKRKSGADIGGATLSRGSLCRRRTYTDQ